MAKNVELGFILPPDFLVEKAPNISTNPWEGKQVVRFKAEFIQAHTNYLHGNLSITFLKTGEFKLHAFVKGENVRSKEINFLIKVID